MEKHQHNLQVNAFKTSSGNKISKVLLIIKCNSTHLTFEKMVIGCNQMALVSCLGHIFNVS